MMSKLRPQPVVRPGDWICIGSSLPAYVFSISTDGSAQVGYMQHGIKAIKEPAIWNGFSWEFKYQGPNGSYLRGQDAAIVKSGPPPEKWI
jgi:hypothetical protein